MLHGTCTQFQSIKRMKLKLTPERRLLALNCLHRKQDVSRLGLGRKINGRNLRSSSALGVLTGRVRLGLIISLYQRQLTKRKMY